jgi:hypothetical protein
MPVQEYQIRFPIKDIGNGQNKMDVEVYLTANLTMGEFVTKLITEYCRRFRYNPFNCKLYCEEEHLLPTSVKIKNKWYIPDIVYKSFYIRYEGDFSEEESVSDSDFESDFEEDGENGEDEEVLSG